MRLWSLHSQYLDTKGLVALWRESLLAKKVIEGKTKGYTNHPQLVRFKNHSFPAQAINSYLSYIYKEADRRGYSFDSNKFEKPPQSLKKISVTSGQLDYEWIHLQNKLKTRDQNLYQQQKKVDRPKSHPLFIVISGEIEDWEIVS